MTKSIKITIDSKNYFVKIERETADNMTGLAVIIFCDDENSTPVMRHFLDFSKHPSNEIESNMVKFVDHLDENFAMEWVQGYLEGKQ